MSTTWTRADLARRLLGVWVILACALVGFHAEASVPTSAPTPLSHAAERCSVEPALDTHQAAPPMSLSELALGELMSRMPAARIGVSAEDVSDPDEGAVDVVAAFARELSGGEGMSCDGYISCSPSLVANAAALNNARAAQANPRRSGPLCSSDDPECWLNPEPVAPSLPQLEGPSSPYHMTSSDSADTSERLVASRLQRDERPEPHQDPGCAQSRRLERPPRA